LIHDDIIDSAYLRRNLPTVNTKWNSQIAVLVGDYLHDKALKSIFENGSAEIFSLFLDTAGTVCDGEIHELKEKGNFQLDEEEYLRIIDKKTAVLLACCVEAGGLFAGASAEEAQALQRFGRAFGIAFQIVDDCLDFTGNEYEFGKTLGADLAAGVITLPVIRLLEIVDSKKKSEITQMFKTPERLGALLELIRQYETIPYSLERAREYSDKARAELESFADSPAKRSLMKLVDYVLERNK
jgi:octaprenyl-diphosphate synthase